MITFKEMIGNDLTLNEIPLDHQHNIEELLKRVNILRAEWGKPMTVTSGYRSRQDQQRIYDKINLQRKKDGLPPVTIPWGSQHLTGRAIDIYDPGLVLTRWLKENNSKRLEEAGLYAEEGNTNWVHLQLLAPKSGKRWFYP